MESEADLQDALLKLRVGEGVTEEAIGTVGQVVQRALGGATAAEARHLLRTILAEQQGNRWAALRSAYGFGHEPAESLRQRRLALARDLHCHVDTLENWEKKAIEELVELIAHPEIRLRSNPQEPMTNLLMVPNGWKLGLLDPACQMRWDGEHATFAFSTSDRAPGHLQLRTDEALAPTFDQWGDPNDPRAIDEQWFSFGWTAVYNRDVADPRDRERVVHWKSSGLRLGLHLKWEALPYPPFVRASIDGEPLVVDVGEDMEVMIGPGDLTLNADLSWKWTAIDVEWRWHGQPWIRDYK